MAPSKSNQMKDLARNWAENTTFNGVPHVLNAKNKAKKLFWFLVVLAGVVITLVQIGYIIAAYLEHPIQVSVDVTASNALEFPAISLCNANKVRKSKASLVGDAMTKLLNTPIGSDAERTKVRDEFDVAWAALSNETQVKLGHQKDVQIIDCSFNGELCSDSDFVYFTNPHFGNCYTFNGKPKEDRLVSHRTGAAYGLTLELYLEQDEYIPQLTETLGYHLVVHHQDNMAYPEDHSVLVSPGSKTHVSVTRMELERLESPYPSDCLDLNHNEASEYSAYSQMYNVNYDIHGCHKSCFQSHVISKCNCGDPKLPLEGQAVTSSEKKVKPCTPKNDRCIAVTKEQYINGDLKCDCRAPCVETDFLKTVSSSTWPNDQFLQLYADHMKDKRPDLNIDLDDPDGTDPRKNLVKLSVFYSELNYEKIQEQPVYSVFGLLADLGGVMGLWLGLSVVALFEFFEMMVDVGLVLSPCAKNKGHNKGYQAPTELSTA